MAKKATKPNPQDATLRNIRALKKRVAELESTADAFDGLLADHNTRLNQLADAIDEIRAQRTRR